MTILYAGGIILLHLYKCNTKDLGIFMIVCCFGHRDAPLEMRDKLKEALLKIIEQYGEITIYVGNHGRFDFYVASVAKELKYLKFPIECYIVLSYVPTKIDQFSYYRNFPTLVPEGIELVHPKKAITYRNHWMIDEAKVVVVYTVHSSGGAFAAVNYAKKKNKKILYLE